MRENTPILLVSAMILGAFLLAAATRETQPDSYIPSEVQSLRLQVRQKDAVIARLNYESAVNALMSEGEKVRLENHWPDTVHFDFNSLSFVEQPPTPKPTKEKK